MSLDQLKPNQSLSYAGLLAATTLYARVGLSTQPTSLLVSSELVELAYELLVGYPSLIRTPIVPVPSIGKGFWAIAGPEAIVVGNSPW